MKYPLLFVLLFSFFLLFNLGHTKVATALSSVPTESNESPVESTDPPKENKEDLFFLYKQKLIMQLKRSDLSSLFFDFPLIDMHKLEKVSEQLDPLVRKDAVNATLNNYGQIIPEQAGIELNKRAFLEKFHQFYYENKTSHFEIPVRTVYPRVDSEVLESIRSKMVGHYVTYFNSGNKERSNNILLAAQAINNHVVFPGEVFSFNKTVGKRTKAKGYQVAPIIVRGELSEDVGGGICQVSSTLFNAVDRSGLKMVERFSHSKQVPYVPPGRDATVSWYGPDFKFKNEYNQPILIRTKVTSGMVIVLVFSSEDINVKKNHVPSTDAKLPPETKFRSVNYNRLP